VDTLVTDAGIPEVLREEIAEHLAHLIVAGEPASADGAAGAATAGSRPGAGPADNGGGTA
jgi:hypothetical protein